MSCCLGPASGCHQGFHHCQMIAALGLLVNQGSMPCKHAFHTCMHPYIHGRSSDKAPVQVGLVDHFIYMWRTAMPCHALLQWHPVLCKGSCLMRKACEKQPCSSATALKAKVVMQKCSTSESRVMLAALSSQYCCVLPCCCPFPTCCMQLCVFRVGVQSQAFACS